MVIRQYLRAKYYRRHFHIHLLRQVQEGISHFSNSYVVNEGKRAEYSHKLLKPSLFHDPQVQNWP